MTRRGDAILCIAVLAPFWPAAIVAALCNVNLPRRGPRRG